MNHTPIVLFPHTKIEKRGIEEGVLERLVETFGSLTLCQPWFTEPPVLSGLLEEGALKVCFPPEALKPQGNFKALLSEYQGWMTENRGGARPIHFSGGETGNETWSIRKAIRDAEKDAVDPALNNTLKWHLILHLAGSLEEDRKSAEAMLQQVTQTKSPLAEAMEGGEPIPDIFEDLPLSAAYPYVTDRHLNLIFEAWFGLFGTQIEKGAALLTLDRQVMNHATDLFDGKDVQPPGDAVPTPPFDVDAPGLRIARIALPRLSNPSPSTDPVLADLSGKTILFVERK